MERDNFGKFVKGSIPFNKGKKMSDELREKMKHTFFKRGNKHIGWTGGKEKYYHELARESMENFLNRKLKEGETVHHKDGNRMNNDIKNLILFNNQSEHMEFHWAKQKEKFENGKFKNAVEVFNQK